VPAPDKVDPSETWAPAPVLLTGREASLDWVAAMSSNSSNKEGEVDDVMAKRERLRRQHLTINGVW